MSIKPKHKKKSIGAYYKSLGIKDCKSKREFWELVMKADPFLADEFKTLLNRKKKGNLYEIKNHTLPFSLAAESWTMSFHKSFLTWVNRQERLKPRRILEIGCDNGLLSCWFATCFPDAEIVGIDQTINGIRCAQELAKQKGLTNVNFYQMNFMELIDRFSMNSFDLIISVRAFHEIMGPVYISKYWSLPEYLKKNPTFGESWYLQIVEYLLSKDGTFLSCERLENPADVGKWANLLKKANLHVQWNDSDIIDYHEVGVNKRSPVILATKKQTGIATMEGMEQLYTREQPLVFEAGRSYSGAKAEFAFQRLGEKAFHSGMYLQMSNHWYVFRFEIWETGTLLLVYSYGNMGHRHLVMLPAGAYGDAQQLMEKAIERFRHLGPIVGYNSLKERPE